jgi:hypothetical protein
MIAQFHLNIDTDRLSVLHTLFMLFIWHTYLRNPASGIRLNKMFPQVQWSFDPTLSAFS